VHKTKVKDYRKFLAKVLESISIEGLPIPKNLLVELLSSEVEDVFEYIVTVFETVKKKGKTPVLVLDEL
jgi:AAA+ ATPase superfamily predicted ATPase